METIRQHILRQLELDARVHEPDEDLAAALYILLGSVDIEVTVDGWALFKVTVESSDSLDVIGLMTLLPSGSVPVALNVRMDNGGLAWSARLGNQDAEWGALSSSKRWNRVYLYASDARDEPQWTWDRPRSGRLLCADV